MKLKTLWLLLTCVTLFSVIFMSCATETTSTSTTSTTSKTTQTSVATTKSTQTSVAATTSTQTTIATATTTTVKESKWWDVFGEPKYGGTISVLNPGIMFISFDNYSLVGSGDQWWLEGLFSNNIWMLDRTKFNYAAGFIPPEYQQGILAESWEKPDPQTMIIHIRQGVRWQNKAPVNGREFTANDVVSHYNRVLGMGDGYTVKSPTYINFTRNWKSVEAVDKYTVKLTFTQPVGILGSMGPMEGMSLNAIEAPEWAALKKSATGNENPLEDWHNAVGTGPWMLTDYVSNSIIVYSRNPDYWDYDERHPENQLPYADTIKKLLIVDSATRLAALRTGKIDTNELTAQEYTGMKETNPEMVFTKGTSGLWGALFRVDKAPFTDVRVRKALQMAVDTELIAKTNAAEYIPAGLISQAMTGFCWAYADWTQSLKDEYHYNVGEAKRLLTEAGFPNGFNTNILVGPSTPIANMQILKAYFKDVAVDMEIKVMDDATLRQYTTAGKHDQMTSGQPGMGGTPNNILSRADASNPSLNLSRVNNPMIQEAIQQINLVATMAEVQVLMQKVDKWFAEEHINVCAPSAAGWTATQPWLKGGSGVEGTGYYQGGWYYARCWVDRGK